MNWIRFLLVVAIAGIWGVIAWNLSGSRIPDVGQPVPRVNPIVEAQPAFAAPVDPIIKGKFDRLKVGMTVEEVEAVLGKAGPSYSSQAEREYYVWKSRMDWTGVIVEQGGVTRFSTWSPG